MFVVVVVVVALPNFFCLCSSSEFELPLAFDWPPSGSSLGCFPGSFWGAIAVVAVIVVVAVVVVAMLLLLVVLLLVLLSLPAGVAAGLLGVVAPVAVAAAADAPCSLLLPFSIVAAVDVVVVVDIVVFSLSAPFAVFALGLPSSSSSDNFAPLVAASPPANVGEGLCGSSGGCADSGLGSGVEETESNRGSTIVELVDVANMFLLYFLCIYIFYLFYTLMLIFFCVF